MAQLDKRRKNWIKVDTIRQMWTQLDNSGHNRTKVSNAAHGGACTLTSMAKTPSSQEHLYLLQSSLSTPIWTSLTYPIALPIIFFQRLNARGVSHYQNTSPIVIFLLICNNQGTPRLWVSHASNLSRPERPKGAKDEVKRPKGPPTRNWAPEEL